MTAFTANSEIACVPTAVKNAVVQREVMEKIVAKREKLLDLRLDLGDALDELVRITDWADKGISGQQKVALEQVIWFRIAVAKVEADIADLQRKLEASC